jgi:hypothetical protein
MTSFFAGRFVTIKSSLKQQASTQDKSTELREKLKKFAANENIFVST